ncbi:MAG TPA: ABC transporter permease [Opitutaceae bacterium]|jgi:hypothetical protein
MPFLDALARDLRLAARGLVRDRAFTLTALITFALCLGANVALFALVDAVLLKPLPYKALGQIVTVFNRYPKAGTDRAGVSAPHYLERRAGVAVFAEAGAYRTSGSSFGGSGSPERVVLMTVTPSFFRVLGITPALGRNFTDEEGVYGKNDVILISDGLWRQNFAARADIIGRTVMVDGASKAIIGVMRPDFHFGTLKPDAWAPLCFGDDDKKDARPGIPTAWR